MRINLTLNYLDLTPGLASMRACMHAYLPTHARMGTIQRVFIALFLFAYVRLIQPTDLSYRDLSIHFHLLVDR